MDEQFDGDWKSECINLMLQIAELKSVLGTARRALSACDDSLSECQSYPVTHFKVIAAIKEINKCREK